MALRTLLEEGWNEQDPATVGLGMSNSASKLSGQYRPSPSAWVREQVAEYEATGGDQANTLRGGSDPIVVITSRGWRSGDLRKNPVMRVERDGRYLAVASNGGGPTDPQWVRNFEADPVVELHDGDVQGLYRARRLEGAEYADWYAFAEQTWATYSDYKVKAAEHDRLIPIFVLEPTD